MAYIPDPENSSFTVINQEPTREEARLITEYIARYRAANPLLMVSVAASEQNRARAVVQQYSSIEKETQTVA